MVSTLAIVAMLVIPVALLIAAATRQQQVSTHLLGSGEMFSTIAPTYDLVNRLIAVNGRDIAWRNTLARSYSHPSKPPTTILDLACGTGDTTMILATTYPSARIIGIDPSRGMLDIAADKGGVGRITYHQRSAVTLTAAELDINSVPVDFATMSFGIRNIPQRDWPQLLASVRSLLADGATFSILEVSDPRKEDGEHGVSFLAEPAAVFIEYVVPVIGGLVSGGKFREYNHLQSSINEFPSPTSFINIIIEGGEFDFVRREKFNFASINLFVFRAV